MNEKPVQRKKRIHNVILISVVIILLVILCQQLVMFSSYVDGDSMLPTLNGGVHGNAKDGDKLYLFKFGEINRQDIVVVYKDGNKNQAIVKRVIAVAGDTIEVVNGIVILNGEELEEPYVTNDGEYNLPEITLAEEEVYIMGDNRRITEYYNKAMPLDWVKGRAFARYDIITGKLILL